MPVKVTLPNGAGTVLVDGAAEEATMRAILAAINKQNGTNATPRGGSVPSGGTGGGADASAAEINKKRMEDGANAEKRFNKLVQGTSESLQNTASTFSRGFSNVTPSLKDFSGVLADYSPEPFATAMREMGGTLGDQVEIFRTLSGVGIDLGDSLLQAQLSAGQSRLPLEIFARTIKDNSQMLSMAFGGATAGATVFAETQGKFMARSGQSFAKLGFSMDELAGYNASYMEQQQRAGRLSKMSTDEIVAGQERYNMELDKLSKATGLSRQQIDEANKATQRDAKMKLALGKLDTDQQAAVNAKIKQLEQLDPTGKMASGFKDIIAGGGVAVTAEARQFALTMQSAGVDASKMGRDIFNGSKTAIQDMNAGFGKAAKASEQITEGERRTAAAMGAMGQYTPMLGKAVLQGMGDVQKATKAAEEEQKKKLGSTDPTRAVAGLDQTLTEVQNSFKKSLIETKVFETTAVGLGMATKKVEEFSDSFAKMNTTEKAATMVGMEVAKQIGTFLKDHGLEIAASYYGAKGARMTYENYKDVKAGKLPTDVDIPDRTGKVPGAGKAGAEAVEKGMGGRIMGWLKGAGKKVAVITGLAGGGVWLATEYDLGGKAIDAMLGENGAPKPAERLSLEQERQRDRTPGAEIPKAVEASRANEPTAPTPPAPGQNPVTTVTQSVNELNASLQNVDYSKLMFPESVGTSIDAGSLKLKNLTESINVTTSSFKDLNNVSLEKLNDSITKLSDAMNKPAAGTGTEKTKVSAKSSEELLTEMVSKLDQLNMSMAAVADGQSSAVDYLSKTAKYTRQTSNNSA